MFLWGRIYIYIPVKRNGRTHGRFFTVIISEEERRESGLRIGSKGGFNLIVNILHFF